MEAPTKADIDINELFVLNEAENFASNDELKDKLLPAIDSHESRFLAQRDAWANGTTGIWSLADAAFRCSINNTAVETESARGANLSENSATRARQASTLFHRHVTQKAANGYAVQASKEVPFKYATIQNESVEASGMDGEARARQMNLLAKWTMLKDNFRQKSIEFWTQIMKYGNVPVMVDWVRKTGKSVERIPVYDDLGNITDYNYEEREVVTQNYPTFKILPVDSVLADVNIGTLQDQECVIVVGLAGLSDIIAGISAGLYEKEFLEKLKDVQPWDGTSGFQDRDTRMDNRDFDSKPTATDTGKYLKREVFITVPVDDKGNWDEAKNVPQRYRVTLFGNSVLQSAVARVERNPEPDDSIPIEIIHGLPDDSDLLYHISMYEVLRSNLSTATTLIRQTLDGNTLVLDAPLIELAGAVRGNDREFKKGQRFIVDDMNAIKRMDVPQISGQTVALLEYVNDDSNNANAFDKNMLGESFGARTSATEAQTIAGNTNRPNLVNIQYILDQFLRFYASRLFVNWPAYGLSTQIIQITDEQDRMNRVLPLDVKGEYDIVVDVVDDVRDNQLKVQRINAMIQTAGQVPEFSGMIAWDQVAKEYVSSLFGSTKYIKQSNGDAEQVALNNVQAILSGGPAPQIGDTQDIRTHLNVYKAALLENQGVESPAIETLQSVIQELEGRLAGGGQQQPMQPAPEQTPGQQAGNELAAFAGGQTELIRGGA